MAKPHGRTAGATTEAPHMPVLLAEVLDALEPRPGMRVLDGTFGAGGYSRALLAAGATVLAIDRDPNVASFASVLRDEYKDSFAFAQGIFSQLETVAGTTGVEAIVLDIGVSSMQLDEAERGFSFMREGPLDMRMAASGTSAAELVNGLDEDVLADLLYAYGDERKSRRIARRIVEARENAPITTTTQLALVIEKAIGRKPGEAHPATRAFQALRIAVNNELGELVAALFAAERILPEHGRLAVVTFHSLEDRIVKRFFSPEKSNATRSRHLPAVDVVTDAPSWRQVSKPQKAGAAEIARNPRARSATLRHARRSAAPARTASPEGLGLPAPVPGFEP